MERYEAYKDSGVEWIGEIPAGWKVSKLGHCLSSNQGGIWGDDPENGNGTVVLRSTEQTIDGNWQIDEPAIRNLENEPNVEGKLLAVGDLLVTKSSGSELHIGKTTIVDERIVALRCSYSNFMQRLQTNEKLNPRFCWYLLNSDLARSQYCFLQNSTSGIGNLTANTIAEVRIPTPPISVQVAITSYLDAKTGEIDGLIADCEQEVELLQEYRKSVISEAVTKGLDPTVPMKDSGIEWIGDIPEHWNAGKLLRHARLESGHTPSRLHPEWWLEEECTIPWITTQDVHRFRDGQITCIDDTELHISQIGLENSSARWLPAGTVALSRTASVGFSIVLSIPMASSQDFADWIPDESLDSFYLLYTLRSMDMIFKQLQMGSTHKTIYMPDIMKLAIAYPPLQEQREIASYLDTKTAEIDALIADKQTMVDKLHEYRKSLISEAVTGKFKVPGA